ncbi:MAG: hypothetical protein ACYC1M_16040 [Armatimonadota bacterium]
MTMNPDQQAPAVDPSYKLALASMIAGFCSLFNGFIGVIALVASLIAYHRACRIQSSSSRKLAVVGISASITGMLILFTVYPVFRMDNERERQYACHNHVGLIGLAMRLYADDNDGKLPLCDNWQAPLRPYTKEPRAFRCSDSKNPWLAYGMNQTLGGKVMDRITFPETTALAFDCLLQKANASGGCDTVDFRHRLNSANIGNINGVGDTLLANVAFADGHAAFVTKERSNIKDTVAFEKLRW